MWLSNTGFNRVRLSPRNRSAKKPGNKIDKVFDVYQRKLNTVPNEDS